MKKKFRCDTMPLSSRFAAAQHELRNKRKERGKLSKSAFFSQDQLDFIKCEFGIGEEDLRLEDDGFVDSLFDRACEIATAETKTGKALTERGKIAQEIVVALGNSFYTYVTPAAAEKYLAEAGAARLRMLEKMTGSRMDESSSATTAYERMIRRHYQR